MWMILTAQPSLSASVSQKISSISQQRPMIHIPQGKAVQLIDCCNLLKNGFNLSSYSEQLEWN